MKSGYYLDVFPLIGRPDLLSGVPQDWRWTNEVKTSGSIMGKGKRLKKKRKMKKKGFLEEFSERLTVNFQKELRNSELWDEMVEEFGEEKATELLKEIKGEVKPGNKEQ